MKEKMRFKKLSLLIVLLLITSFLALAQVKSLSGIVTDNTGLPLPGVTVLEKGTTRGAISDADGQYNLSVEGNTSVLVFSYIGMKTQEVIPGNKTVINVVLEPESIDVDEVVVVGYGTQKKRDLTGSIASVDNKAIEQRQAVNVFDALQGAAAGVQVSSVSGAPGASNTIQIRGASTFDDAGVSPLYVVDNVIVEDIDNINPGDIKSIEILKDAASGAIYGARSANGVVIITTKSGEAGTPKIDVRVLKSFSTISNKIPQVNAFERVLNDASTRGAILEKYRSNNDSVGLVNSTNYFYQDYLTRTAVRNDVNLGISGGSDKIKYMASLGYIGDEGVILTSYNHKYTARFNVDFQISKKLKSMTRLSFSNSKTNSINEGGVFQTAMRRPPNMILYYPDGSYAPYYAMGGNKNPVQELTARDDLNDRYQASLYQALEFKFNKYLSFQTSVTGNFDLRRDTEFASKELDSNGDENLRKNSGSDNTTWGKVYQGDAYFSFLRTFNKNHTLNAMVGSSLETGTNEYLSFDGSYFVTESIHTMNMASTLVAGTTAADYAIAGFFGRLGYAYKGKYLFNSNVRYDGSSRFGANERWGLFPSASLGWRFSDENFMAWSKGWLSDAKLRGSWGVTGNDRVGYYESQTRYTSGTYTYNGISGVVPVSTYGNPNLHWEETRQSDIGLDLSLFDGRASFTADYYIKETSDLLSNLNLPYTSGYNNMRVNLASIENRGLEFSLSGYPVRSKNFTWQTTMNWWTNENTITDLAREDYVQSSYYYVAKGQSAGLFYGYKNLGIYEYDQSNAYTEDYKTRLTPVFARDSYGNVIIGLDGQPSLQQYSLPDGSKYEGTISQLSAGGVVAKGGDVIWENMVDATGMLDDKIDDNDRTVLGKANPDWYGSWSNNVTYKNFTLSFNFYTSWGGLVYNKLKRYYTSWGGNTHMQLPEYIRTGWIYPGQITNWYAIDTRNRKTINRAELSDFYLEDATFIRLRNVRLSYNVDNKYLKNSFVKGCMVYVYGNNLLTWTNYSGYDPEVGGGVLTPGTDNQAYPRKREVGFGLNVNF
jgi:TonB-linked SusC/RagA family outer membrane protein